MKNSLVMPSVSSGSAAPIFLSLPSLEADVVHIGQVVQKSVLVLRRRHGGSVDGT